MRKFILLLIVVLSFCAWSLNNGGVTIDNAGVSFDTSTIVAWDISDAVVAQYKMNDDAASTVIVDSIDADNGVLGGGDTTDAKTIAGHLNGALTLNGSDDYIDCSAIISDLAVSDIGEMNFWFKMDAYGSADKIYGIDHPTNTTYTYLRTITSGGTKLQAVTTCDSVNDWTWTSTSAVDFAGTWVGNWVNISIKVDGSEQVCYINNAILPITYGAQGDKTSWWKEFFTDATAKATSITLGAHKWTGTYADFHDAQYDNFIFVVGRTLTDAERTSIYNAGAGTEALSG